MADKTIKCRMRQYTCTSASSTTPTHTNTLIYCTDKNELKISDTTKTIAATPSIIVDPPPGTVIDFAGKTLPTGYLHANGAAVSRTTYSKLFAKIGTRYGAGNGSTTFNLPNYYHGEFRGLSTSTTTVTYKNNSNHTHVSATDMEAYIGATSGSPHVVGYLAAAAVPGAIYHYVPCGSATASGSIAGSPCTLDLYTGYRNNGTIASWRGHGRITVNRSNSSDANLSYTLQIWDERSGGDSTSWEGDWTIQYRLDVTINYSGGSVTRNGWSPAFTSNGEVSRGVLQTSGSVSVAAHINSITGYLWCSVNGGGYNDARGTMNIGGIPEYGATGNAPAHGTTIQGTANNASGTGPYIRMPKIIKY